MAIVLYTRHLPSKPDIYYYTQQVGMYSRHQSVPKFLELPQL